MPHSLSEPIVRTDDQLGYSWVESNDGYRSMVRQLSNLEHMFVILNRDMHGQNCPFMGASISLKGRPHTSYLKPFNISELHSRAIKAFCQTRWKYPTVAARLLDGNKAAYSIETTEAVKQWADRTVFTICQDGGWLSSRERLSRESPLPTPDGDCCRFYLIIRPEETTKPELQTFDVLMHTHHAFTDGSGIRVILNEFLERLADPLPDGDIVWGEETQRLLPAAVLLEKIKEPQRAISTFTPSAPEERLKGFHKADVGLPVYRPDILGLKPEYRGTLLVSHTFKDPSFLPQLQSVGRKHGVKLTGILHAAILKALYEMNDSRPSPDDIFNSGSPMDLRNGYLMPEYCDRTRYVNSAVAIQPMKVPCRLFQTDDSTEDGYWKAAQCISNQWEIIKTKKGLASTTEADAKALIESIMNARKFPKPQITKPRTCPTFSSDPPGSQGFRGIYSISEFEGLKLVLDSYQLATDQIQAVVSARSHSWNGLLTLCLVFNALRNPKEKMQEFLDKWTEILLEVSKEVDIPSPTADGGVKPSIFPKQVAH